jgi:hypothetical protein
MLGRREGAGRGREQNAGAERDHRDVSVPWPDSSNAHAAVQDGDASTVLILFAMARRVAVISLYCIYCTLRQGGERKSGDFNG